jgi:hypothetical protein
MPIPIPTGHHKIQRGLSSKKAVESDIMKQQPQVAILFCCRGYAQCIKGSRGYFDAKCIRVQSGDKAGEGGPIIKIDTIQATSELLVPLSETARAGSWLLLSGLFCRPPFAKAMAWLLAIDVSRMVVFLLLWYHQRYK